MKTKFAIDQLKDSDRMSYRLILKAADKGLPKSVQARILANLKNLVWYEEGQIRVTHVYG